MKLLELYSLSTGLRIGKQSFMDSFYPLECDRYITFQGGSGMAAKNYPFYDEVLALILPILKAAGIEAVQLGGKDDHPIRGCHHQQGKTNLHQSSYLLSHSLCHVGNDSWLSHRGGELGIPLVICFGPTTPENHGPYRFDDKRSTLIQSHRFGRRPTFANQEAPSTIAAIPPEQVANAVLSALQLGPLSTQRTLHIGEAYNQHLVELVPNVVVNPQLNISGPLIVRMDYASDDAVAFATAQDNLFANLQFRKCAIVLDREIDLVKLKQCKANIVQMRIEVDKLSVGWIKAVKRLGIPIGFFTNECDANKLAALRLTLHSTVLFDQIQPPTKEDFIKGAAAYLNKELDKDFKWDTLRFKTYKMLLSDDKIYLSKAHWQAGQPTPSVEQNSDFVIDTDSFWNEQACYYFYTS